MQVLDQNRQKHAATTREIASLADLMKERIDHLAARRPDRALNATRLQSSLPGLVPGWAIAAGRLRPTDAEPLLDVLASPRTTSEKTS